jgi:ATP-dependent exoDNAse (exonuclease V) beta subunit
MALDAEEALPQDAAEDAVQVMTIHKAKGLEFGHVYLAQLHARGRPSERNEFDADRRWDGLRQLEYSLFDVPTLGFDTVERHRERVSAAEQVRTLYVAMTRAKKRLVLVGNWPEHSPRASGGPPTYVELLGQREHQPPSILGLSRAAGAQPDGVVDAAGVRWKFPGLHQAAQHAEPSEAGAELPSRQQVEAAADTLAGYRREAARRMERPFLARASRGESDEHTQDSSASLSASLPYSRAAALAIGKAVHSALESWDLAADPGRESDRQEARVQWLLESLLTGPDLEAGKSEVSELLARLRRGRLLQRLLDNPESVIARELPILIPPAGEIDTAPIAGISGTVDLVLRDSTGRYTVVDFKTDRVENDEELSARAEIYAAQLAVYARAIGDGLQLEAAPGTEIWFLWPDQVWPAP